MVLFNKVFGYARLIIYVLIVFSISLQAQRTGGLKGTVTDKKTGEMLPGANVMVNGTSIGTACNFEGEFILRNIPPGKQKIVVSYIGYDTKEVELDIPEGKLLYSDFELSGMTIEGEEVVITAQAVGQLQAINQQLAADNIANIVSEAKIQQLPDFNAASALSRLPGISTTQTSGEDNKVVIRGLSPKYNSIEIEGVKLSSTGSSQIGLSSNPNSGNSSIDNDRSVDLTMVSPYMIRMISVYKSLTPDMNANSIGGTVNMELREAPSDLHYNFLWQQGYTAKSNTLGNFRAVASGSDRFFNDNLGVYLLVNAESYDRNSDNMDARYNIAGEEVDIDPITGYRPVKVQDVSFNRHLETRQRYGGNLIMDYNLPNGSLKFVNLLARINSDYTDHKQKINYDMGRMEWQLREGVNITDQQMHSLKLDYDFGWINTDLSVNYTSSSNTLDKSPEFKFNQVDALQSGVPRDNLVPQDLVYLLTEFKGDSNVVLRSGNLYSNDYEENKLTYKADFEIPFNLGTGLSGFIKFGGQIYNQENSTDQETPYLRFNGNATSDDDDIQTNLMREIAQRYGITVNEFGNLSGSTFLNSDTELFESFLGDKYGEVFYVADPEQLNEILNYIIGNPDFDASNSRISTGAQGGWYDGPYQQLTNDYNYKEDYYAAYAMSKINFLDFMIIGGIRFEQVESEYFAYNARDMRDAQSQVMYDTTAISKNDFFLPMVQVKYSPFDWMDVRYAYTHTLSRPDYHQISPKFTITQDNRIYTGNPELVPAKAFNHDVNFTFHANKLGLLTVGAFYKTIENFVYKATYQLDAAQGAGIDHIDRYTIVRDGQNVVIPQSNAIVQRPFNNPNDATVKGIEIDLQHNFWYLPEPFNNLVFGINYARISSETIYPYYEIQVVPGTRPPQYALVDSSATGRLIDQPNHILNTYIGYDYKGFSSRLSILFQDNSAKENGGEFRENDSFTTEYFRIDFSARQKLPFLNSELFLDISNLNSANSSSIQRSTEGFKSIENYGLTANLGFRIIY